MLLWGSDDRGVPSGTRTAPLRTRDVARASGYSVQQVRDLERLGVIPPATRSPNGYRSYTAVHVHALGAYRGLAGAIGAVAARQLLSELRGQSLAEAAAAITAVHVVLAGERDEALRAQAALRAIQAEAGAREPERSDDAMTITELATRPRRTHVDAALLGAGGARLPRARHVAARPPLRSASPSGRLASSPRSATAATASRPCARPWTPSTARRHRRGRAHPAAAPRPDRCPIGGAPSCGRRPRGRRLGLALGVTARPPSAHCPLPTATPLPSPHARREAIQRTGVRRSSSPAGELSRPAAGTSSGIFGTSVLRYFGTGFSPRQSDAAGHPPSDGANASQARRRSLRGSDTTRSVASMTRVSRVCSS